MLHGEPNYGSAGSEAQDQSTAIFWELKKSSTFSWVIKAGIFGY